MHTETKWIQLVNSFPLCVCMFMIDKNSKQKGHKYERKQLVKGNWMIWRRNREKRSDIDTVLICEITPK